MSTALNDVEREELLARRKAMKHDGSFCRVYWEKRQKPCPLCAVEMVFGKCCACDQPRPIVVLDRQRVTDLLRDLDDANKGGVSWVETGFLKARSFLRHALENGGAT